MTGPVTTDESALDILDRKITVCDRCLQASCWQGVFMCDAARSAGTREATVAQLALLRREASDYWFRDPSTGKVDEDAVRDLYVFDENTLFEYLETVELPDLREAS
jgi:hypothetical protein